MGRYDIYVPDPTAPVLTDSDAVCNDDEAALAWAAATVEADARRRYGLESENPDAPPRIRSDRIDVMPKR